MWRRSLRWPSYCWMHWCKWCEKLCINSQGVSSEMWVISFMILTFSSKSASWLPHNLLFMYSQRKKVQHSYVWWMRRPGHLTKMRNYLLRQKKKWETAMLILAMRFTILLKPYIDFSYPTRLCIINMKNISIVWA